VTTLYSVSSDRNATTHHRSTKSIAFINTPVQYHAQSYSFPNAVLRFEVMLMPEP
jgi:hypothetical protein